MTADEDREWEVNEGSELSEALATHPNKGSKEKERPQK